MPFAASARIGQTLAAFTSFDTNGLNTDNQVMDVGASYPVNFPARFYRFFAYFAGNGAAVTARLAAWKNAAGFPLIGKSPQFTAPSGSAATNGQSLQAQYADGSQPILGNDAGASQWFFGWWRAPGGSTAWSIRAGNFYKASNVGADITSMAAASACGVPYTCGSPQAYCDVVGGDMRTLAMGFPCYRAAS